MEDVEVKGGNSPSREADPLPLGRIYVNGRALTAARGGVRRYAQELIDRLAGQVQVLAPGAHAQGVAGHLWEQCSLPFLAKGVLWSPANTGPWLAPRHVVTIHDVAVMDHPEWFSPRFARWYGWLTPRLARRAATVITDSEFSKTRIQAVAGVEAERIAVVYPGVGPQFQPQPESELHRVAARLRLPSRHYILSLATQEPRKNLAMLLQVWATVQTRLPRNLWLVLAGSAGKASVFAEAAGGALPPRVWRVDTIEDKDLPGLYAGARLFVFPSLYEGFGLPPLEAMACGAPVLAARAGSLPEVLGSHAQFLSPADAGSWASALQQWGDPKGSLPCRNDGGVAYARRYCWQACADQVAAILRKHA